MCIIKKSKTIIEPNLYRDLEIYYKDIMMNMDIAKDFYKALCNNCWIHKKTKNKFQCTWRYAGRIISNIRNSGSYMDFYCSGKEGLITKYINKKIRKLGYRLLKDTTKYKVKLLSDLLE